MTAALRTLLIDNHDSFTSNLFHLLAEVNGRAPTVVRNDDPWADLDIHRFDNIVISPGPGHPAVGLDVGISVRAITDTALPLLGVCLGHQLLCHLLGGRVTHAPEPVHGRSTPIHHAGDELFARIPSPFPAVRYHSLAVSDIPPAVRTVAWTADGVVMAVRQDGAPRWGVQFHPESVLTAHGRRLLDNLRTATVASRPASPPVRVRPPAGPGPVTGRQPGLRVHHRRLNRWTDPAGAFVELFAGSPEAFWLDRSADDPRHRFSFMGDAAGPLAEVVTYDVRRATVTTRTRAGTTTAPGPLLDHLDRRLRERQVAGPDVPFGFDLGYVGYLGYELKAECGGRDAHRADAPDAALVFADRLVAFDHHERRVHLLCLGRDGDGSEGRARRWLDRTARRLSTIPSQPTRGPLGAGPDHRPTVPVSFRHPPDGYLGLIAEAQRQIRDGESYEVCLTNQLAVDLPVDPLRTYLVYRRLNPAPHAAYLRFGELAVLSASPERFLRVGRDGTAVSEPIKGTRARGTTPSEDRRLAADLRASAKDRAENLMVVDLVRHDLGVVCEIGTVEVPTLFDVRSYATVHQLVSTIRGRLSPGATALDAVRSAFPGGSMTGAPKERTMEIIDRLEGGPRGIYSGVIGYLGLGGGADLSIVIRTLVATPARVTVGVGGAIVAMSDPQAELEETLLKGRAALDALGRMAALVDAPR